MIREYQASDLDNIMSIWLDGNKQAHNFIDESYFINNYDLVKSILPMSTIFVQDIDGVQGFIGLTDNYIAGLFVAKDHQRQGSGQALVVKAKQLHNELYVHVYKKNHSAQSFYLSQGFEIVSESINEDTHEAEYLMCCRVEHNVKIGKCAL